MKKILVYALVICLQYQINYSYSQEIQSGTADRPSRRGRRIAQQPPPQGQVPPPIPPALGVRRDDVPEHTTTTEAQLIVNDLQNVPGTLWPDIRYMTSFAVKPGKVQVPFVSLDEYGVISEFNQQTRILEPKSESREVEFYQLASMIATFCLNSISLQGAVNQPYILPGSNGRIIRFNLSTYGLTSKAWDEFTANEPYFSDLNFEGLEEYTGNFRPVIRTDWFLANAFYEPNYSRLLYASTTIPTTEDEFIAAFGFDIDAVQKQQRDRGHVVSGSASTVSFNDRRLQRYSGILDYLYRTNDFSDNVDKIEERTINGKKVTVTLLRNPSSNLLTFNNPHIIFDVDASEYITQLPNGLQGYALTNKQRKIVADADVNIVRDSMNLQYDPIVRNAASCIWCHGKGLNIPGNNSLVNVGIDGIADIKSYSPEVVLFLQRFYNSDFGRFVRDDQVTYQYAVAKCNGMLADANAQYFQYFVSQYKFIRLTAEDAARELGVTVPRLRTVAKASYSKELLDLFGNTPLPLQREIWESQFQATKLIERGAVENVQATVLPDRR